MRAKIFIVKDIKTFKTTTEEHHWRNRAYCKRRWEYEESVRHHQENDDPALPVINRRGVALIPSLASRNEPPCEPRTPFYRQTHGGPVFSAISRRGMWLLPSIVSRDRPVRGLHANNSQSTALRFDEGLRKYITPILIDDVPSHTLEVLDYDPHPSRETARHKGDAHSNCRTSKHEAGRYADKDGCYWQRVVTSEREADVKDGPLNKGKGPAVSTDALPGPRIAGKQDSLQTQGRWDYTQSDPICGEECASEDEGQFEDAQESVSSSARSRLSRQQQEVCSSAPPRLFSQLQGVSSHSAPIGGEESPFANNNDDERHEGPDQCDVFENAQKSLSYSVRSRHSPKQQRTYAHFDPFGEDPSRDDDDADDIDQLIEETDQSVFLETAQENLSSLCYSRQFPHQQDVFRHFDPFDYYEQLQEDDEWDVPESNQEIISSTPTRPGYSSIHRFHWTMPESKR